MAALFRQSKKLVPTMFAVAVLYFILASILSKNYVPAHEFNYVKSTFDWSNLPQRHPVRDLIALPQGALRELPQVQHDFTAEKRLTRERITTLANRRSEVEDAFIKSWNSYKRHAWMCDELAPVSGTGKNTFGGWAATIVDALDTLWIMGLEDEFYTAVAAVVTINWEVDTRETGCNFFETTIRYLGGLLSAYDLSNEIVLLDKAIEVGDMLYAAFDTLNRMPPFWLDFQKAKEGTLVAGSHDPSAAVTSSSLEFTRLAQLTGDNKYYDAIARVTNLLQLTQNNTKLPGMWPTFFDMRIDTERLTEPSSFASESGFTLGALADSLYEYLLKTYALLGGLEPGYETLYRTAMETVTHHLLFRPALPNQDNILFTGSLEIGANGPQLNAEGEHLLCFAGGMYAFGGRLFDIPAHVEIGEKLIKGCAWAYALFPTGIMPEVFHLFPCPTLKPCYWDKQKYLPEKEGLKQGFRLVRDTRYLLRPEAIESVFLLYRITGNAEYQEIAWNMFQAIKKSTETDLAFSAINDVTIQGQTTKSDSMESFWLSETLKYFYLIFSSPEVISLDDYILNTEAHPLKRP